MVVGARRGRAGRGRLMSQYLSPAEAHEFLWARTPPETAIQISASNGMLVATRFFAPRILFPCIVRQGRWRYAWFRKSDLVDLAWRIRRADGVERAEWRHIQETAADDVVAW